MSLFLTLQTTTIIVMSVETEAKSPSINQRVFVMRHGERLDSRNRQWRYTAARPYDTPLTGHGHSEANRLVKARLTRKGVEMVFASPFLRCLQTAHQACLALDLPGLHTHNNLCELLMKENGMTDTPLVPCKEDAVDLKILTFDSSPLPKFPETIKECKERYLVALNTLADEYWPKTLLLVTHEVCVREAVSWGGSSDEVEATYCGQVELARTNKGVYDWKLKSYDGVYTYDLPV